MVVNHIDENSKNNNVENLEIISQQENVLKARRNNKASKHNRTKYKLKDIETGEELIFNNAVEAGKYLGMYGCSVIFHADQIWSDIIYDKYQVSRII